MVLVSRAVVAIVTTHPQKICIFLGVDLIVEGVTFIFLGFPLRRALRLGTV